MLQHPILTGFLPLSSQEMQLTPKYEKAVGLNFDVLPNTGYYHYVTPLVKGTSHLSSLLWLIHYGHLVLVNITMALSVNAYLV